VTAAAYLLLVFHRKYLGTSLWSVLEAIYVRPIASAALAVSALLGIHQVVPGIQTFSDVRYLIPFKLAVDCGIFVSVYIGLLVALRQVSTIDWNNFQWLVAFGLEFLRRPFRERVKV
jgi:hypothetical protein